MRTPFGSSGVPIGTAQKNGSASRVTRSGAGASEPDRQTCRPAQRSRDVGRLSGHVRAGTDDVAEEAAAAGLFILGLRLRSIAYLNVWAVTGSFEGGEKRKPCGS